MHWKTLPVFLLGSGACGSTVSAVPPVVWSDPPPSGGTHWSDPPLSGLGNGELQSTTDLSVTPYHFLSSVGAAQPLQQPPAAPASPSTAAFLAARRKPSPAASPQTSPSPRHLQGTDLFTGFHMNKQQHLIVYVSVGINAVLLCALTVLMMPGNNQGSARQPPAWGPEMEHRGESAYTFRQWSRDLLLWTIANDMEPHRQAALILGQLRGAAASLTREIPINVIMNGGIINGQPADPTTYILHVLGERYAQLGEETRLRVMTDLMMFEKRRNERIDDLLTRFDVIRQRVAGQGGGINMNYEGLSWLLLRACQPNDQQLLMLLQEFQGRYPNTEAQFRTMTNNLRRMGHILENSPDNIAQQLRHQQGHQGMYMANGWWGTPTNQPPSNPAQPAYHQQQPYWGNQSAPWSDNSWTGNQWSGDGWSQPPPAYNSWSQPAYQSNAMDSETDTDTESSLGDTQYDFSDLAPHLTDEQRAESIFWAYQRAKGKWRRFMNKPHRRVRRHMKRKGKGKGKHPGLYLQSLTDYGVDEFFFGD